MQPGGLPSAHIGSVCLGSHGSAGGPRSQPLASQPAGQLGERGKGEHSPLQVGKLPLAPHLWVGGSQRVIAEPEPILGSP